MFKLPFIFGRKKLLLAFEYGLTLAETARKMKVKMTPELVERAETMIEGEFTSHSAQHIANHMTVNLLSAFELDMNE